MCLMAIAVESHSRYRLILAANRDEYFQRPTAPASFWEDVPQLLAGRDLQAGGTWLGVTTGGRLAAVTNYREPQRHGQHRRSRGRMVTDFLAGNIPPQAYLETIRGEGEQYGGFNLIVGDREGIFYYSNRGDAPLRISPGIHGLSNHLLDTPWPKVVAAKERLQRLLREDTPEPEALFALLSDTATFPDQLLPDTGVGLERERLLSSLFIAGSDYGTRSSTLILIDRDDRITFMERSFDGSHAVTGSVCHCFSPS